MDDNTREQRYSSSMTPSVAALCRIHQVSEPPSDADEALQQLCEAMVGERLQYFRKVMDSSKNKNPA